MSAISIDEKQGFARDHAELFVGGYGESKRVVVDISHEDEDQLCISWDDTSIYLPADRVRRLLEKP